MYYYRTNYISLTTYSKADRKKSVLNQIQFRNTDFQTGILALPFINSNTNNIYNIVTKD